LALYRRLAAIFIVLTLVVLGFAGVIVFSRASVVILVKQESVKTEFILEVAPEPADGELRGGIVQEDAVLERQFNSSTAATAIVAATGRVSITSKLSRPQALVATTRLITDDGKLYRLRDNVTVPAQGSVEADIYADVSGPEMEAASAIFTIPGLSPELRRLFTVETVTPISGSQKAMRIITRTDVENATASLKEEIEQSLIGRLREVASEKGLPIDGEVASFDTLPVDVNPVVGTESPTFVLKLKVSGTGIYYDKEQLQKLTGVRIREMTAFDRRLVRLEDKETQIKVEKLDLPSGSASVRVVAVGLTALSADSPTLDTVKLVGITTAAAEEYLKGLPGVAAASVKIRPFWYPRLPNIADNIRIEVR
jgi:hypothetical protein